MNKVHILYLANIFQADMRWIDQIHISDYFLYNFHFAIIKKLLGWQFQVTFKPHPESFYQPNLSFESSSFNQINDKKIEEIFKNYDLFIFDKIKTSSLGFAEKKKLPRIVIPLGENKWICNNKKKKFYLNNNVIDYSLSIDGKVSINWNELKHKIINLLELSNERNTSK